MWYIAHYAEGTRAQKHKYIDIINGRYIYPTVDKAKDIYRNVVKRPLAKYNARSGKYRERLENDPSYKYYEEERRVSKTPSFNKLTTSLNKEKLIRNGKRVYSNLDGDVIEYIPGKRNPKEDARNGIYRRRNIVRENEEETAYTNKSRKNKKLTRKIGNAIEKELQKKGEREEREYNTSMMNEERKVINDRRKKLKQMTDDYNKRVKLLKERTYKPKDTINYLKIYKEEIEIERKNIENDIKKFKKKYNTDYDVYNI